MTTASSAPLITILDADRALLRLLVEVLHDAGYRTQALAEGATAHESIKDEQPNLVVLDTWLETKDAGWDVLEILRLDGETRQIPVLIHTTELDEFERRALRTAQPGQLELLNEPFDVDTLVSKIKIMLSSNKAAQQAKQL